MRDNNRGLNILAFMLFALLPGAWVPAQRVSAVGPIRIVVEDADRSVDFYTRVLDFRKLTDEEREGEAVERLYGVFGARVRAVRMALGDEQIELIEFVAPRGGTPVPRDSRSNDRWFQHIAIVTTDMDRAFARLREHKVKHASTSPQSLPAWNPNAGGIRAFYFRDPDDHDLEVICFPPGKGDPKWRDKPELFPGIDHTAIVVADTTRSLRFYRELLGMRLAGASENYGIEQSRLNNVEGAHLKISGLRAPAGPGVEFLEYVSPNDGRLYPMEAKPNDLTSWETTVFAADVEGLVNDLRSGGYRIVSRHATASGAVSEVIVRDADGHFVRIVQPPP